MALRPISRLDDYVFPEGAWDVTGWTVRTARDDEKVGRVSDMLVGRDGELRYLDVDLGFLKKHILVPLGRSHTDRESETVFIEGVPKERLDDAPEYALDPETLTEGYERRLDAYYDGRHPTEQGAALAGGTATGAPGSHRPGPEDDAGHGAVRESVGELRRMGDLDDEYQVAGDDPRGWKVVTGDGVTAGRVSELIVAPGDMKARYLDVSVDEKELELEPVDRHVLLPTDQVRLDRSGKKAIVSGMLAPDFGEYPQYGGLPLDDDQVGRIHSYFGRTTRHGSSPSTGSRTETEPPPTRTGRGPGTDHFYGSGGTRSPEARSAHRTEKGMES